MPPRSIPVFRARNLFAQLDAAHQWFRTGDSGTDFMRTGLPAGTRTAMPIGRRKRSMRILIAYDGSPSADAAVGEVIRRPWPQGSEVRVVTVVEPQVSLTMAGAAEVYVPLYERMRATLREDAYKRIQGALNRLQSRGDLKASYDLREGDVKHGLLDAIREWKADLVI